MPRQLPPRSRPSTRPGFGFLERRNVRLVGAHRADVAPLQETESRPPHQRSVGENPQFLAALVEFCAHRDWILTTPKTITLTGPGDWRSRNRPAVPAQPILAPKALG